MKRVIGIILLVFAYGAVIAAPAFSADIIPSQQGGGNEKLEMPPQELPPMPKQEPVAQPSTEAVNIPPLPESLPCKPEWLHGLWELQHVYESPLGTETQAYNVSPIQYISFGKDSRLYRYNAGKTEAPPQDVFKLMTEHSGALLQYLLQDAGMLYFYQDSVATDTQVCFIVAQTKPPYGAGNLLLLPPKGQINGRLIKVYKKVWPPKQQAQPPHPQQPAPQATQRTVIRHYGR